MTNHSKQNKKEEELSSLEFRETGWGKGDSALRVEFKNTWEINDEQE